MCSAAAAAGSSVASTGLGVALPSACALSTATASAGVLCPSTAMFSASCCFSTSATTAGGVAVTPLASAGTVLALSAGVASGNRMCATCDASVSKRKPPSSAFNQICACLAALHQICVRPMPKRQQAEAWSVNPGYIHHGARMEFLPVDAGAGAGAAAASAGAWSTAMAASLSTVAIESENVECIGASAALSFQRSLLPPPTSGLVRGAKQCYTQKTCTLARRTHTPAGFGVSGRIMSRWGPSSTLCRYQQQAMSFSQRAQPLMNRPGLSPPRGHLHSPRLCFRRKTRRDTRAYLGKFVASLPAEYPNVAQIDPLLLPACVRVRGVHERTRIETLHGNLDLYSAVTT